MPRFYATVTLWAALSLIVPSAFEASFAGATDQPEKSIPQGQDPPGADNAEQLTPAPPDGEEVIPPPPIGDEDIHIQAPNRKLVMRRKSSLHLRQAKHRASRLTNSRP